jgi:Fe-S cluster assembly iron-binding protein IscA
VEGVTRATRPAFESGDVACKGGGVLYDTGKEERVLTLTENASTIVRDITAQTSEAPDAGLRITTDDTPEPAFAISAAEGPQPGDATVEQDGATVYLDDLSSQQLDDKVLDAQLDPSGNVQFALGQQA